MAPKDDWQPNLPPDDNGDEQPEPDDAASRDDISSEHFSSLPAWMLGAEDEIEPEGEPDAADWPAVNDDDNGSLPDWFLGTSDESPIPLLPHFDVDEDYDTGWTGDQPAVSEKAPVDTDWLNWLGEDEAFGDDEPEDRSDAVDSFETLFGTSDRQPERLPIEDMGWLGAAQPDDEPDPLADLLAGDDEDTSSTGEVDALLASMAAVNARGDDFNAMMGDVDDSPEADALDWLREVAITGAGASAVGLIRQQQDRPVEELDERLARLRERGLKIRTEAAVADTGQLSAILPGIDQTLAPLDLGNGDITRSSSIQLTADQQVRADLLASLVASPEPPVHDAEKGRDVAAVRQARRQRRRVQASRLIMMLLLAAALGLPFLADRLGITLNLGEPPAAFAPGSVASSAYNQIDTLEPGQKVLVAVEYGPRAAGELDDMTETLLRHVLMRGAYPVIISSSPIGLEHAGNILATITTGTDRTESQDYTVGRYLPGGIIGLRELVQSPDTVLSTDSRGRESGLAIETLNDFALMIVVVEQAETVRSWMEQVAPVTDVPFVIAAGYSAQPMITPYVEGTAGISGLLVGYPDALTYNQMLRDMNGSEPADLPAEITEDAQAVPDLLTATVEGAQSVPDLTRSAPTATPKQLATATFTPSRTPTPTITPTATPVMVTIGRITSSISVNVRSGPGTAYAVVGSADPGEVVLFLEFNEQQDWVHVRFSDGTDGWIARMLMTLEEAPEDAIDFSQQVSQNPQLVVFKPLYRPLAQLTIAATVTAPSDVTAEPDVSAVAPRQTAHAEARWQAFTIGIIAAMILITTGNVGAIITALLRRGKA